MIRAGFFITMVLKIMFSPATASRTVMTAMDQAPLDLGDALVMSGKSGSGNFNFAFTWQGFPFAVKARTENSTTANPDGDQPKRSHIQINGHLGHLPYSGQNIEVRVNAMAILEAAGEIPDCALALTKDQQIVFKKTIDLDQPLTPTLLVTEAAKTLLRMKPYLELLSMFLMTTALPEPQKPAPGKSNPGL